MDNDPTPDLDRIARRHLSGLITMEWALRLTAWRLGSADGWPPIVAWSEATKRVLARG